MSYIVIAESQHGSFQVGEPFKNEPAARAAAQQAEHDIKQETLTAYAMKVVRCRRNPLSGALGVE